MVKYFKCDGLNEKQRIKAAKLLAKMTNSKLADDFGSSVQGYNIQDGDIIMNLSGKVDVYDRSDIFEFKTQELKVKLEIKREVVVGGHHRDDNALVSTKVVGLV